MFDEIAAWRAKEFEWGRTDCCQFVRRVTEVISGKDYGAQFPAYESEFGAARLIAEYGGLEQLLCAAFGESRPALLAQRGDVVLCDFGRGPQPSICLGAVCVAPAEAGGLESRPLASALASWKI
ncbi:MAG TPA: hypothetical protein VD932_03680 [Aquabacterium sp.]|nr:hypothetical protein [Aquabacterium sp.]